MLRRVTRMMRMKAAVTLALLYAFCVLAPHAAMALLDASNTAHCLVTQDASAGHDHAINAQVHQHADGTTHTHDDSRKAGDDRTGSINCCGLFAASAIAHETRLTFGVPSKGTSVRFALTSRVDGEGPSRINRPPISL